MVGGNRVAAVFYVVDVRGWKGRTSLPKGWLRRPEAAGSISPVSAPKARLSNHDNNVRVQNELVAHFQKSRETIGRATMLSCGIFAWIRVSHMF
jgi:hypothetical protein